MNASEKLYYEQINNERLYWKHKYYEVTQGSEAADRMRKIDEEVQSRHPVELLGK